jgi:hypothetical protein
MSMLFSERLLQNSFSVIEKLFSDSKIASTSEKSFRGGAECVLDEEEHFLDPPE